MCGQLVLYRFLPRKRNQCEINCYPTGEFRGAINAVKNIVAKERMRGLYAGYGSFLLRDLPFDAIEFVSYEQLKRAYTVALGNKREVNAAETAAMGA